MTQPISSLNIEEFERLPFTVQAVQVTASNMAQVAKWCGGKIKSRGKNGSQKFIKVEVKRALNERQTEAQVDDWVLKAGSGFKVYTPNGFETNFRKKVDHMMKTVRNMVEREKAEDKLEEELDVPVEPGQFSEGGVQPTFSSSS